MLRSHVGVTLLSLLFVGATNSSRPDLDVTTTVKIINCREDLTQPPTVTVSTFGNLQKPTPVEVLKTVASDRITEGVYQTDLVLEPRNYTFMVRTLHCKTPGPVNLTLFSGYNRHFIVAPIPRFSSLLSLTDRAIGIQTPDGAVVRLEQGPQNEPARAGIRDGNVTYFENLSAGQYDLELRVRSVTACTHFVLSQGSEVRQFFKLELPLIAKAVKSAEGVGSRSGCQGALPDFALVPENP